MPEPKEIERPFKLKVEAMFRIGEIVFIRVDIKQRPKIVTAVSLRNDGTTYIVRHSDGDETEHADCELSLTEDTALKTKPTPTDDED